MKFVKDACDLVGGQTVLARLLKIALPTVNQWVHGVRMVPAARCPSIERATGGLVRCEELRPDIDWAVLRGTAANPPEIPEGSIEPPADSPSGHFAASGKMVSNTGDGAGG